MNKFTSYETNTSDFAEQTAAAPLAGTNPKELSLWGYFVKCLKNYKTFEGRARRREFLGFSLFSFIFCILTFFISAAVWLAAEISWKLTFIPALLCWLALFMPLSAVSFRRIQDTGKNGRYLLYVLIPYKVSMTLEVIWWNMATPAWGQYEYPAVLGYAITLSILASAAATVITIVWLCQNSQPGKNNYGENPKGVTIHPSVAKRHNP
ncbi:MAG: DUF805 domain-containing protein [Chitinispirillia bacterium]|nr:DUF805 domain-containing protein [Chitinispirillia bacterium]